MKPGLPHLMMLLSADLGGQFAPALPNRFLATAAQIDSLMCVFAGQEAERGAAVRIASIRAMKALFAELGPLASPDLRARLEAAVHAPETDYSLSGLDAGHAALSTLLIALHEEAEALDGAAGKTACAKIWTALAAAACRRQFSLAPA